MEDRKYICPCYRHVDDIARDGHCICHLFVDESYEPPPEIGPPPKAAAGKEWPPITLYGARWCSDTIRTTQFLNQRGVPYEFVDVDRDASAADRVRALNEGCLSTPTVVIDGRAITEPSESELADALALDSR